MKKVLEYLKGGVRVVESKIIGGDKKDGDFLVADVRGWGRISNLFGDNSEAIKFQDAVGKFIADAINEKIEREKEADQFRKWLLEVPTRKV